MSERHFPESPSRVAVHAVRDLRHPAFGMPEKAVLYSIADRLNGEGVTWASILLLAEDSGGGKTAVGEIFRWLVSVGVIVFQDANDPTVYAIDLVRLANMPSDVPRRVSSGGRCRGTSGTVRRPVETVPRSLKTVPRSHEGQAQRPSPGLRRPSRGLEGPSGGLMETVPRPQRIQEGSKEGSKKDPDHAQEREVDFVIEDPVVEREVDLTMQRPEKAPPLFELQPPEPLPKSKRGKTAKAATPEQQEPPKAPKKLAHERYLEAFREGMSAGFGRPFAPTADSRHKLNLANFAIAHCRDADGKPFVGEDLVDKIRERAEAFARHALRDTQTQTARVKGGWSPEGLLAWHNAGCPGEPPRRPPVPVRSEDPAPTMPDTRSEPDGGTRPSSTLLENLERTLEANRVRPRTREQRRTGDPVVDEFLRYIPEVEDLG